MGQSQFILPTEKKKKHPPFSCLTTNCPIPPLFSLAAYDSQRHTHTHSLVMEPYNPMQCLVVL